MRTTQLVDMFVERNNASHREPQALEGWRIRRSDNVARIGVLEKRTGVRFPPSFRDLLSRYSFPAFECGSMLFFANTGEDVPWELATRLFLDPHLSPVLLRAGYLQIGNPAFFNYDPVCFAPGKATEERRIVQLDHETMLQFGKLRIVREIASSFIELMRAEESGARS